MKTVSRIAYWQPREAKVKTGFLLCQASGALQQGSWATTETIGLISLVGHLINVGYEGKPGFSLTGRGRVTYGLDY